MTTIIDNKEIESGKLYLASKRSLLTDALSKPELVIKIFGEPPFLDGFVFDLSGVEVYKISQRANELTSLKFIKEIN